MNKATQKALRGSILKWERIVSGTGTDEGVDNCPLCKMFLHREMVDDRGYLVDEMCGGCPVAEATEYSANCLGSPYYDYKKNPTPRTARRMVNFLVKLLPPEGRT